jgi:hypothetical protein
MKLPKITTKQQEILKLLYRYRFLNRIQIQKLMKHKDYRRINAWLKDLREKHYVEWIYSDHFLEKTKPAIYYLGLNGIRHLKQQTVTNKEGKERPQYPLPELRKRYRECERSESFIARSTLIADCCINLQAKTDQKIKYDIMLQADYVDSTHNYRFLAESDTIMPDLCIVKEEIRSGQKENILTNYLLEVFDATLPRYRLKYRLSKYVEFLSDDEWESGDNDPSPIMLLVCPTTADLIYAKHRTKNLLNREWEEDDEDRPHVRFATTEQLKKHGTTAKIWEEGRALHGI